MLNWNSTNGENTLIDNEKTVTFRCGDKEATAYYSVEDKRRYEERTGLDFEETVRNQLIGNYVKVESEE